MSKLVPWSELEQGIGCPFDLPRDGIEEFMCPIRELSAATLYLSRHQTYRGSCVLIFDPRHVTRIDELCSEEWTAFAHDLGVAERAVFRALEPDHMNVASLGAVIPHLHWHIIPRYRNDLRWGGPVWTTRREDGSRTELEQVDYDALVAAIRDQLDDDV